MSDEATAAAEKRRWGRDASTSAAETTREHWARQLMRPEWMVDVPRNLAAEWCSLSAFA